MQKWKKTLRYTAVILVAGALFAACGLYALDFLFPFPMKRIEDRLRTASTMVYAADGSLISWRVDTDENLRLVVPRDRVSPWLEKATIAVEDKRFREHHGVDFIAIGRAVLQNLGAGRRMSGASTITMQTVRLLWQRPRTFRTKFIEAFRAWQLERLVDKDRILEIYFNLAPYGGNVVGVEAAAKRYFDKSSAELNLAEACLLAGIPQSPARHNPLLFPESALRRRDFVIHRMVEDGLISTKQAARARREPLVLAPPARRLQARHFADFMLERAGQGRSIHTTLNPDMQIRATSLADRHGAELASGGASGPAVVVMSVEDSSILAYIGNASPDGSPSRLVDAARSPRQPGSLLKPFIFAMLAGDGRISPSSRVYDLPRAWGEYAPHNMDREWRGALSAADALRESRNITAVAQLQTAGADAFADFTAKLGLQPARSDRYGLAAALGAKEQTLLSLVNAYAAMGRLGYWLPVRFDRNEPSRPGHRVIRDYS